MVGWIFNLELVVGNVTGPQCPLPPEEVSAKATCLPEAIANCVLRGIQSPPERSIYPLEQGKYMPGAERPALRLLPGFEVQPFFAAQWVLKSISACRLNPENRCSFYGFYGNAAVCSELCLGRLMSTRKASRKP